MKLKKLLVMIVCLVLAASVMVGCGATAYNIPIVCGETGMNDVAGVATYGVDYYNLGVQAGDMAADILLDGADVSTMAVGGDPNPALSINETVATQIGFTIPDAVKDAATGGQTQTVTRVDSAIVESGADYTIGILQLVQHVALDLTNEGFKDQLSVRMDAANKTVKILDQNAAGDQSNNMTIASNFVSQDVDLIYAIATSAAQAAKTATEDTDIPVLFNAVTNPVDAGLVDSLTAPGGNVSGVSDMNPVEAQIELIRELTGKETIKVGLLYTSAEVNSQYQVSIAKAYCEEKGYTYVEKGIGDLNDIEAAFITLSQAGVDAIYIPTDNALASGIANVHSVNIGK